VCDTISKLEFIISCKTIEDQGKPLIPFHITGTFEEFVQHGANNIP
jgi:hypothetical protein